MSRSKTRAVIFLEVSVAPINGDARRNESQFPASRAANWSHCSLYPATNQRVVTKLSAKSKTFLNSPSRRSTVATTPGFHRPSNRRHAT
ncbi:hypothetical protein TNCV_1110891 [Trichonephila clavipes]|nr:hypothetical protein TNCV_1110891 [Trichonephila clavipes]